MAIPLRRVACFSRNYLFTDRGSCARNAVVSRSTVAVLNEDVQYPPIKPKYPPGVWGEMKPKKAWELHETRETLLSKETAKWRLEEMAGVLPGNLMWIINSADAQPKMLSYKQYVTKTHMEKGLPEVYNDFSTTLDPLADRIRPQVEDVILLENEHCLKMKVETCSHIFDQRRVVKQIMDVVVGNACHDVPHLLQAQVGPFLYACTLNWTKNVS